MDPCTLRTKEDHYPDLEKHAGNTDRLSVFREQVGITAVPDLGPRSSKRKAANIGIYSRVATEEREAKFQYFFSALLINTCLLAQVVFASALTALGAGSGSHTQITILGAANTVIAAVLTFTKGQGLPNRLRQYQCHLRKIREHIEQRERDFAQFDCQLDINLEVRKIIALYEEARQNDENNDPNRYHTTTPSLVKEEIVRNIKSQRTSPSTVRPNTSLVIREAGQTEGSKEEVHEALPRPMNADPSPTNRTEDSEKWKIAYSVADRLLSNRLTSPAEDHVPAAESSSKQLKETVDPKVSEATTSNSEADASKDKKDGNTTADLRPTHADGHAMHSQDSERSRITHSVADSWYQANLGGTFEGGIRRLED